MDSSYLDAYITAPNRRFLLIIAFQKPHLSGDHPSVPLIRSTIKGNLGRLIESMQVLVEVFKLRLGAFKIGLDSSTFSVIPKTVFNRVCILGTKFLIGTHKECLGLGGSTFLKVPDT